ncbi:MAG: hypothetical protein M1474_01855, partial [Candidatus Marsarchaeota archaeon]|nr:hypothetical protein [Candidatus Marsarchaeota archaeon]
ADVAPPEQQWKGASDPAVKAKWEGVSDGHRHFQDKYEERSGGLSVAVNGEACILCQACLVECEGECITIVDDNSQQYQSIYK